jgi:hypothetical protein
MDFFLFIDTGLLISLVNWCTYTTYQPPTKVAANNVHVEDNPTGILYICEVELNHAQLWKNKNTHSDGIINFLGKNNDRSLHLFCPIMAD